MNVAKTQLQVKEVWETQVQVSLKLPFVGKLLSLKHVHFLTGSSGRGTHSGDSDDRGEVRDPRSFSLKKHGFDFADSGSFCTDDEDDESFEALHEKKTMHLLREVRNIPINHFQKLLGMNDVQLIITPEAMEVIVAQAQMQNAGGDGIRTILEKLLFEVKYLLQTEIQMQNKTIKAVEITEDSVLGKAPPNFLDNMKR